MNDIFNLKRFGKYYITDLRRCIANYGLSLLVTALIGVITYLFLGIITTVVDNGWMSTPLPGRIAAFGVAIIALLINMPSKCYGYITEKQAGSNWILIPASLTEKFVSIILNTLIVIPLAFIAIYFTIDSIIVALDPNLDTSLFGACVTAVSSINEFIAEIGTELSAEEYKAFEMIENNVSLISGIDDCMVIVLSFVLGALVFKKNKAAKTILAWIAVSMAFSIILTPIMFNIGIDIIDQTGAISTEAEALNWVEKNIVGALRLDKFLDLLMLTGFGAAIFFRLKTIKH